MTKIKTGHLDPVTACLDLLEEASLDSNGMIKDYALGSKSVGQKVLQTFHDFHRTWFSANTLEQIQDYSEELNKGSTDIYDPNEQAYYITNALFSGAQKYSDILKGVKRFKGIRKENVDLNRRIGLFWNFSFPSRVKYGDSSSLEQNLVAFRSMNKAFDTNSDNRGDEDFSFAPKLQIGELIGIKENTDSFVFKNLSLEPLGADRPGNKESQLNYQFDLKESFGGGVLGLPSYFMMNMGHTRGIKFNGTTKLPRRWIKAAFETFMCSSFPTLRESDIRALINVNSETPFRRSSSCVQCHATLDQAASVARNLTTGSSDYFVTDKGRFANYAKHPIVITKYNSSKKLKSEWVDKVDSEFHISASGGKLYTRSTSGELISRELQSIEELGLAMSQTIDFYNCAAKRYFEFFTGIQVPLYDRKDPRNEELNKALTEEHLKNREFVESLGRNLQHTQSLKNLVQKIMKSKFYLSENYR
ncbi:MAG: hypothetical protein HUU56_03285 [Bdellovibrionaceae bacterium]|nr:hypothetical protein [Pseudobdellovibrionaceae bacterium]